MIIYFFVLALIVLIPCQSGCIRESASQINRDNKKILILKSQLYVLMVFLVLALLMGLRRYTVGFDLRHHYLSNFYKYNEQSWNDIKDYGVECGLFLLSKVIGLFSVEPQAYIIVTSIVPLVLTIRFFYRHSTDFKLSVILFFTYCLAFQYMNQIAQTIAVSFILLAYDYLETKNVIGYIVCVLIATTFHTTAFFCILFWLIYKISVTKKSIFWFGIGAVLFSTIYSYVFEIGASFFPQYEWYSGSVRHGVGDTGLGVYVKIIMLCIVVVWSIWESKFLHSIQNERNTDFLIMMSYAALLFQILTTKMIVMNRMGYYALPFVCVLLPECINSSKSNKMLSKLAVLILMILYFSYITIKWGNISYGVVPYEFFWK